MSEAENRIHVEVSPQHAYERWNRLDELPRFLEGVRSVEAVGEDRTRWVQEIDGQIEEWEAVVEREPGSRIAWRDAEGRHVREVRFAEGDADEAGVWVTLHEEYRPSNLRVTAAGLAVVQRNVADDLWRFKVYVEEGPEGLRREEERPLEGVADDYVAVGTRQDVDTLPGEAVATVADTPTPLLRSERTADPADFDDNVAQFSREERPPDLGDGADWTT